MNSFLTIFCGHRVYIIQCCDSSSKLTTAEVPLRTAYRTYAEVPLASIDFRPKATGEPRPMAIVTHHPSVSGDEQKLWDQTTYKWPLWVLQGGTCG